MKRLIVGLTGTFGSGKSTAGRMFKRLGARRIIDCDRLAHEVFRPRHPAAKKIRSLFGFKGSLNRKRIAKEIFSDPGKRRRLESIVHPYVYRRIQSELAQVREGIVILEVPLLFETGFNQMCDVTVAVGAGERHIVKRLLGSGFSLSEVRARLRAQLPAPEKKRRADLYIQNSGSKVLLAQKTKVIWNKLASILNQKSTLRPPLRAVSVSRTV